MTIFFHQSVMTPNGPGTVQGRLVEKDETIKILVSHDPRKTKLPPQLMEKYHGGPWVLWAYPPEDVTPQ